MKKAALFLAALGVALLWLAFRDDGWLAFRDDGANRLPVQRIGESMETLPTIAARDDPVDERRTADPLRRPQDGSGRAPLAAPPAAGLALRALLESDYAPVDHVAVHVVERASGKVAGAPRKTYDVASWTALEPGSYRVQAAAEGWTHPDQDVELVAGVAEAEVRLQIHPLNWLAGDVVDQHDGRNVTEFQVEVQFRRADGGGHTIWSTRRLEVRSDDGRFALGGAPDAAEDMCLVVSANGYLATTTDWVSARAHVDDLVVELGREGLAESFVSARAVHATGTPAPGTTVLVVDADATMDSVMLSDNGPQVYMAIDVTGEVANGGARAETDGEGWARIATRYEGPARLLVVPGNGRAFLTQPFDLHHGREVDLGELRIEPGGEIAGQVWIGNLRSDMAVRSVDVVRQPGARTSARLEEDGAFRVGGLEAGFYRVSAIANISGPEGLTIALIPVASVSVWVGDQETRYVDLHCGAGLVGSTVRGRVERIQGLDKIRVVVLDVDLSPVRLDLAGDDGSFALTDVPDGEYTLAVMARSEGLDRFAATWQPLSMPSAARVPLDVRLLHSRVELHAPGAGKEWFDATARTESTLFDELVGAAMKGTLDENGYAVVWGLPAGTYRFRTARGVGDVTITAEGGAHRVEM